MKEILVTERQQEIYTYIDEFIRSRGYPPTRQEIADHFGFKSCNAVQQQLIALQRKGAIKLTPGISRGIVIA